MTAQAPATLDALVDAVTRTSPRPLQIVGGGSRRPRIGAAPPAVHRLDTTALTGITAYDPAECVVTARAGTPVRHVAATLAAHRQYLPWDPPVSDGTSTIGGMVATGLSGPGRLRYGGVRDFVIGARVVDGRGRLITSGGQVVKNAAGFLLHHALVGSAGRLGVIAEVSLKVFPAAEATATLVASFTSLADALAAHERLRRDGLELDALDLVGAPLTLLVRLAGASAAMPARLARARRALAAPADTLTGAHAREAWAHHALAPAADATLVKVPSTPSRVGALLAACGPHATWHVSCGGAVVYLRPTTSLDDVHDALTRLEALHATLTRLDARGVVVGGADTGRLVGRAAPSPFGDRVRATLDPDGRFC